METNLVWKKCDDKKRKAIQAFCEGYKDFISKNKTERMCVKTAIEMAQVCGYKSLEDVIKRGEELKSGDKVWATTKNKAIALVHIGKDPLESGMNILGAHIDSPRLDIKQNPLFEKCDFTFLDTHYYGGIKKYQWVTIPLAIHGVVALKTGEVVEIHVGDEPNDPVFCITDLLPHLGAEQMKKEASKVIEGDALDILIGNMAEEGKETEEEDKISNFTLKILKEKYGFEEEDFLSAELEVVPAGVARDLGFDRSMVLGYGQDDRVCAYTSLLAQLELAKQNTVPQKTAVCLLVDKEEIGSVGASGMESTFFENTVAEVANNICNNPEITLRRSLSNSKMLSSDVNAGVDPAYENVFETKNASFCGHGLVFSKFTGARGKSGSNDANAEYIAHLRKVLDDNDVAYQFAELGKVDIGGGGTIAYIPANLGVDVIDSGVAVLSMHSPWEVTSKVDIWEAYRGYLAFLKNA